MFFLFRIEFCGKIGLQPVRTTNTSHQKQSIEYILSTPITYALKKKNINVKFNTKLPFFKKPKISNPYIRLFKIVKKNYKRYMVSVILKKITIGTPHGTCCMFLTIAGSWSSN